MNDLNLTTKEENLFFQAMRILNLNKMQLFSQIVKNWLFKNKELIENKIMNTNFSQTPGTPGRSKFLGSHQIERHIRERVIQRRPERPEITEEIKPIIPILKKINGDD